jgi:hypothetical protein
MLVLCFVIALLADGGHAMFNAKEPQLNGGPSKEEAECLQYLHQNMPQVGLVACIQPGCRAAHPGLGMYNRTFQHPLLQADYNKLAPGFLYNNVLLALKARSSTPWAQAIPWRMFLDYVSDTCRCAQGPSTTTSQQHMYTASWVTLIASTANVVLGKFWPRC